MSDEKKKRNRTPGGVRITVPFTDELRLAIGGGKKATNEQLAEWAKGELQRAVVPCLRDYYRTQLDRLDS